MIGTRRKGLIGELAQARETLFEGHLSGLPGSVVVRRTTDWVEGVIKRLYNETQARYPAFAPVGLAAVGGFGRGELNLHSDVDLLFIYPPKLKPEMERLAEQVLYPLWDLRLDVGHAARTIPECLSLAAQDFSVLVSMLTARTIAGSPELIDLLGRKLAGSLKSKRARQSFLDQVEEADEERQNKFGHTPNLLEPNLKEGEGGLRDIHAVTWLGLGCFGVRTLTGLVELGLLTDDEVAFMGEAREFLWRVRNHLHYLAKKHDDQLTFERQEQVARFLEYKDEGGITATELFMRDVYTRAHHLRNIRDMVFERVHERLAPQPRKVVRAESGIVIKDNRLHFASTDRIEANPGLMMRIFTVSGRTGIKVSHQARLEVRDRLHLVNDEFRRDPRIRDDFFDVLIPRRLKPGAVFALHSSGLLIAYLPELAGVFQLPQNDAFHIFTVDTHLLRTVHLLHRLGQGRGPSEAGRLVVDLMGQLKRPRVLYLAALLHDIGKGGGKGHSERGVELAEPILERLAFSEEEARMVKFLILRHLLLMETALRRDIHDEKLLFSIARSVGDEERLGMLYLLTVADSLATGERAWSNWQSTLLIELYFRTLAQLTRDDIDYLGTPEWLEELKETVVGFLEGKLDRDKVEAALENLPDQYLLSTRPKTMAEQIVLQEELGRKKMVFSVEEKEAEGYCQFTVITRRRRGVFGRMAGVLTLNGLNILGAQIHNRRDNISTLLFQTEFPADKYGMVQKWTRVGVDMERALSGRLALSVRVDQRLAQTRQVPNRAPRRPAEVEIDNTVSDFHTVVEVAATDRPGLLYDITRVFFELDLEIHIAKIYTRIDQIVDVFYVTDVDGQKSVDDKQLTELKGALGAILE